MKVNVFPLVSSLHSQDKINENTKHLIGELMSAIDVEFNVTSLDDLYEGDLALILIQSGGS